MASTPKRGGRGPKAAPFSLRGHYGAELEAIRQRQVAAIDAEAVRVLETGGDLAKAARLHAKALRAANRSDFDAMVAEFRSDIKKARKAGLYSGKAPTPAELVTKSGGGVRRKTFSLLDEIGEVLTGGKKAQKIGPQQRARLEETYRRMKAAHPDAQRPQIIGDRIILDREFRVSKAGTVERHIPGFTRQRTIYFDGQDVREVAEPIFKRMNDKQVVVIIIGENHSTFYHNDQLEDFLADMEAYEARGAVYVTLGLFDSREQAAEEMGRRSGAIKAVRQARVAKARAARKAAERAASKGRTGPKGAYRHSGKQGPSAAQIRADKAADKAARRGGAKPNRTPPKRQRKPISNRKRGR